MITRGSIRRRIALGLFLIAILVLAAALWPKSQEPTAYITLTRWGSTTWTKTYCLTNQSAQEVVCTLSIGFFQGGEWQMSGGLNVLAPDSHRKILAPHGHWCPTIATPDGTSSWRLRIDYAQESKGLRKLLSWIRLSRLGVVNWHDWEQFQTHRSFGHKRDTIFGSEEQ